MKKRKSSGGRKVLIFLTGLLVIAVLVMGVVWTIWIKKTDTIVVHAPPAKRMKVPPMPEAQQIKPPTVPTQKEDTQTSAELAQAQTTVNPAPPEVMPDPSPPREAVEPSAIPAPQPEEEPHDAPALDETPPDDRMAGEKPERETVEMVQSVQESSQAPPPAPQAQKSPQQTATTAPITERFNLQVGAYRVEAYAQETVTKLLGKGYAPFILKITDTRQRPWYTVRIGRYKTRQEAVASLESFKRKENIAAVIATAGNL